MTGDVGVAEDLAQDALLAALEQWPRSGVPDKPGAWLMATAKNRAIDRLRHGEMAARKEEELGREVELRARLAEGDPAEAATDEINDDLLSLIEQMFVLELDTNGLACRPRRGKAFRNSSLGNAARQCVAMRHQLIGKRDNTFAPAPGIGDVEEIRRRHQRREHELIAVPNPGTQVIARLRRRHPLEHTDESVVRNRPRRDWLHHRLGKRSRVVVEREARHSAFRFLPRSCTS